MKRIICMALAAALLLAGLTTAAAETWNCSACGATNDRKFCGECGAAKPEKPACASCGFELKPGKTYKFCSECGAKFASPVTVNTPAPTPAATSTPAPVEREFIIDEISTLAGGGVRIHWQDNAAKGPYKVCYEALLHHDYDSDVQQATVRWVGAASVADNSVELPFLVPGAPYWITVFDADGVMVKEKHTPMPRAALSGLAMSATLQPQVRQGAQVTDMEAFRAAELLSPGSKEYGMNIRVGYRALKEEKTYICTVTFTCPDGYQFVETVDRALKMDKGATSIYWEFYDLAGVFNKVKKIYGTIPTGEYTWSMYLDARLATSATFTIQ